MTRGENSGTAGGGARPRIVVIAGVPRSGSTWLFNATRLVLEQSGATVYPAWCDDYQRETHLDKTFHLVKLHRPDELKFQYDYLLTTRRPEIPQLASLMRMGWLPDDPDEIRKRAQDLKVLYDFWSKRSDLEIQYDELEHQPEVAIARICRLFSLSSKQDIAAGIASRLKSIQPPEGKTYDPITLLHPNHRAREEERTRYIRRVTAAFSSDT